MRGSSFEEMSRNNIGLFLSDRFPARTTLAALRAAACPLSLAMRISLKVFHCPHEGHFPIHFADSCPQLEQTYAILSFAMILDLLSKNTEYFLSNKM